MKEDTLHSGRLKELEIRLRQLDSERTQVIQEILCLQAKSLDTVAPLIG